MAKIDDEIKVILIGESATGKTSLINTSIGLQFKEHLDSTATNSFVPKKITIGKKNANKRMNIIPKLITLNLFMI